jgi:hypothetical protein
MPAAVMLKMGTSEPKKRCTTSGLMKRSAKNAMTTLGTEASVSRIGFRKRRDRLLAYSDR